MNGKYPDEDGLKHYANIVYSKCKGLKTLVDDLFEYSKLNGSGIKVNRTKFNLTELLEQVVLGFFPVLKEAGMEHKFSFPNEKIIIHGDAALLARMFDNLVSNAIHYGKEGKYLELELEQEDNEVIIRVINFGEPIPKDDLPLLFERFYKVDKSRSLYSSGSGIGLAIVKSIVELHGGTVGADSRDDRTIFWVRLPL